MCRNHSEESYTFHKHDFITHQVSVNFQSISGEFFQSYVLLGL